MFEAATGVGHSRQRAAWTSLAGHALLMLGAFGLFAPVRDEGSPHQANAVQSYDLIWQPSPGAGGGGGGGGDRTPVAARARAIGRDRMSVPVTAPSNPSQDPVDAPRLETIALAATPLASALDAFMGAIAAASPGDSRGPGSDAGAGTERGGGSGSSTGSGLGDHQGGGFGNDAFAAGNGVSTPQLLREVTPKYTAEAMRARLQGTVLLECVVRPDGRVGDIRILRSLDRTYGLDEEAIAAARQWRFAPGRRHAEPVPVRVVIELSFRIR